MAFNVRVCYHSCRPSSLARPNEDVSLMRRLTGRYSLWNEAVQRLPLIGLQSVTMHSFGPLVGFETSEKLDGRRVSSRIKNCSNITGNHQKCFCSPAKALSRLLSDWLAGSFTINPTFIYFMLFYCSFSCHEK